MRILVLTGVLIALIALIACNAASPAGSDPGASATNPIGGASGPASATRAAAPVATPPPVVRLNPAPAATATPVSAARTETPAPAVAAVAAAMPAMGAASLAAQPPVDTYASEFKLASPFSLPSAQGPSYTLDSFAGSQNVVLVFYRAFW